MGIAAETRVGDALFGKARQRVLAILFRDPNRTYYANELIRLVDAGTGAVQRELARLEAAGLVVVTRRGKQKHYRANRDSPVFDELRGLLLKTTGMADVVGQALGPLANGIRAAFIFGSVARRRDTAASDIDLMVISDRFGYAEIFAAVESATQLLSRRVNPTVYTPAEFGRRLAEGRGFLKEVLSQPKIWIIGGEHDIAA